MVEDGFQGAPGRLPPLGQGHEFSPGQDVAAGRGLTGIAELAGQGRSLLDDERFDGVSQARGAGQQGGSPRG